MKKILIGFTTMWFLGSALLTPVHVTFAQVTTSGTATSQQDAVIEQAFDGCSLIDNFDLCFLWVVYNVFTVFSAFLAGLAGKLFDFFLYYSLNSEAYQSEFITKGWGLIRDLANVLFIFTLLYLAIRHVLGMSAKKYIPTLIIVALMLNFSMFFTKVAIDAGNILARAFFNSIVIQNDAYAEEIGFKSISVGLVEKIQPQRLLSEQLFKPRYTTGNYSTATGQMSGPSTNAESLTVSLQQNTGYYFLIFVLFGIVNFTLVFTFLSVALLFLGRTIGLWFALIFSPIAFITLAVPGTGGIMKSLSFDSWKDNVLKLSFVAPVFIFFLYLAIMFMSVIFSTPIDPAEEDTFMTLLDIIIPFLFVVLILKKGKDVANDMAGEIGQSIKSFAGKALGLAGGAVLGVGAFAARATIGRMASQTLRDGGYKKRIKNATGINKWRLIQERAMLKKFKDSSFDIRNAPKAKGFAGKASGFIGGQLATASKEFGGDKVTFGKGSDQSRKKYEEGREKDKLEMAKELAGIDPHEDLAVIQRLLNKHGVDGKDYMIERLDGSIRAIDKSNLSDERKQEERNKLLLLIDGISNATDEKELKKVVGGAKKAEESERRNNYADYVENDPWYRITTDQNEITADKIRVPEEDKLKKISKLLKPEDEDEDETPPPAAPPPPPPPPPAGGAGTP